MKKENKFIKELKEIKFSNFVFLFIAGIINSIEEEKVCQALSEQFGHGITQLNATGYYEKQKLCAVYFVVNRFQIPKLKSIVKETDPGAFVTITEVSDFMGSSIKKK